MADQKPQITFDDFAKLDLRVAKVLECEPHPNADRLLKLQLDVGPLGQRQICAGIRNFYDPNQLVGEHIVIVANLEPRKIRGELSEGMLIAASVLADPEDVAADPGEAPPRDVVYLTPVREAPAGSTIG